MDFLPSMITNRYVKNFLGIKLPEEELTQIENPIAEILGHTAIKSLEVGVVGSLLCGCMAGLRNKSGLGMRNILRLYTGVGPLSCVGLGTSLCYAGSIRDKTCAELADRCYMLRKNQAQLWYDRCTLGGYVLGGTIGLASFGSVFVGGAFAGTLAYSVVLYQDLNGYFENSDNATTLADDRGCNIHMPQLPSRAETPLWPQALPAPVNVSSKTESESVTSIAGEPKLQPVRFSADQDGANITADASKIGEIGREATGTSGGSAADEIVLSPAETSEPAPVSETV